MANKEAIVKVKLSVNSKEYNQAVRAANQEAKEFKRQQREAFKNSGANEGMSALLATAKKLAPAISAGSAALAVANKAMKENQTFTDEWARITEGARASYEHFVDTLVSGDFSNYFSNMRDVIATARDAADAIDNLDTTKIFSDLALAQINLDASKYRLTLRSKTATTEEKELARQGLVATRDRQMQTALDRNDANLNAFAATLASYLTRKGAATSASDFVTTGADGRATIKEGSLFQKYYGNLATYNKWNALYQQEKEARGYSWNGKEWIRGEGALFKKGKGNMSDAAFAELEAYLELSDDKLREVFGYYQQGLNDLRSVYDAMASDSRYITSTVAGVAGSAITAPEGSIAYLRERIAQAKKEEEKAVDDVARHTARRLIEKLEEELNYMLSEHLSLGTGMALGGATGVPALNPALVGQHLANIPITPPVGSVEELEDNFKASEYATQGLNLLTDTIGRLGLMSNIVEPEVSKFLNVFGSIVSQVGSAIGGPVGGVLSGIGGLLGSFAGGGIVGGTSYKGDNLLQAVNSKEMILNGYQQKNLLSMINAGGGGSQSISYVIKGEDIYVTLSNYKRRTRRS